MSGGAENGQIGNPLNLLEGLEKDIFVDDSDFAWAILAKAQIKKGKNPVTIDFILDNAGYELFTDLCLATYLISIKLAEKIRIYVKKTPWFISDVTKADFYWMIRRIAESSNPVLSQLGKLLNEYLESGAWSIEVRQFFTLTFVKKKNNSSYPPFTRFAGGWILDNAFRILRNAEQGSGVVRQTFGSRFRYSKRRFEL